MYVYAVNQSCLYVDSSTLGIFIYSYITSYITSQDSVSH